MNNFHKKCIGKLVEILHIIFYFALIIVPFVSKKIIQQLFCLLGHATIIFMWYHTGDCVLTPLENYLTGKKNIKHEKVGTVSNVYLFIKKITGLPEKIINPIMLFLPITMIYLICFRIYNICNC